MKEINEPKGIVVYEGVMMLFSTMLILTNGDMNVPFRHPTETEYHAYFNRPDVTPRN